MECLFLDEGELISAGLDGYIRVRIYIIYNTTVWCIILHITQIWDFEIIDSADITEDNTVFEMEPLTEIKVN